MRVFIDGESDCAATLRGYLKKAGDVSLSKSTDDADYTIILVESDVDSIFFDSIECDLERSLLRHVRSLSNKPVGLKTSGGIQTDNAVRIFFPASEARAVELGVQMGFADFAGPGLKVTAAEGLGSPHLKKLEALYARVAEEQESKAQYLQKSLRAANWKGNILLAVIIIVALLLGAKLLHGQDDAPAPPPPPPDLPLPLEPSDREKIKDLWVEGFIAFAKVEDATVAVERYSRQAADAKVDVQKRQKDLDEINNKIAAIIASFREKYKAHMDHWCLTRQLAWIPKSGDKPCPAIFADDTPSPSR